MIRTLPLLCALAALSACATPREACISAAREEFVTFSRLLEETRANIDRGYAVGVREVPEQVNDTCDVRQPDGSVITQICPRIETREERFPVAINLAEERAKLAAMEQRLPALKRRMESAQTTCVRIHPE